MTNNREIAILIPCYNESATIEKVVTDFRSALPESKIYVYDNNSTDGTAEIAEKAGAIVRSETRQGKGNVVRSQFRDIEADVYVMVDGDDTYEASNVVEMVRLVEEDGADMVIGDRLAGAYFQENKRRFHGGGNVLVRKLINLFFKSEVNDIMTGFRAFSHQFVKSFPVLSQGFEIETEMTIFALDKDMRIKETVIEYRDRPEGSESKLNTISDGFKVIGKIFSLVREFKPLQFYTLIGSVFAIIGLGMGVIPVAEFFNTGFVTHFPTLIVAVLFIILSFNCFTAGWIMGLTAKKHRQLFEINLNLLKSSSRNN